MKKVIRILPHAFRRRGLAVAGTLLLRALLNLAGLAALLPVLALVLTPSNIHEGPLAHWYTTLGFTSERTFAAAVCTAVVVVVLVKNLLNLLLARIERSYIYDLYRTLSRRLFTAYRNRGAAFVKSANSAILARNVNVVCLAFTAGVLRPAAAIAAETMLLVLLAGALALYAPAAALLTVGVFLPSVWLYLRLVRNRINRYGERENRAQREKARLVAETFRGYADIEVNGAFPAMLRNFERAMDEVVRMRRSEAAVGLLPQVITETGLALGLALLAAWGFTTGGAHTQMLFGIFAVAALRLMPSVKDILSSWAAIRYNRYTVTVLTDALDDDPPEERIRPSGPRHDEKSAAARQQSPKPLTGNTERLPFEHQIVFRGVCFRYADGEHNILDDFSLTVSKSERIGFRGPSGAGKTTLVNLLLGLYEPTAGRIEIDGVPLTARNRRAWQNRIGYVSQRLFLLDGSLASNVALGISEGEMDRERVLEALEAAQLGEFVASLPQGIDTHIGECGCRLSGGQRQRIGIARALYRRADVLVFDEATSELDSTTEREVARSIDRIATEKQGLTLLVVAHRESSLAGCGRIVTIGL